MRLLIISSFLLATLYFTTGDEIEYKYPLIEGVYELQRSPRGDSYVDSTRFGRFIHASLSASPLRHSNPKTVISVDDDEKWRIWSEYEERTKEYSFHLGDSVEEEGQKGTKCKSVFSLERNDTLLQIQKCEGVKGEVKQLRKFDGEKMTHSLIAPGTLVNRIYKKLLH